MRIYATCFLIGLSLSLGCFAQPYVVTHVEGQTKVNGEPSALFNKLTEPVSMDLGVHAKTTLTSLKDGSRISLSGPLQGTLVGSQFKTRTGKASQVVRQSGRNLSLSKPKDISASMGAHYHREPPRGIRLFTAGNLLEPTVAWSRSRDAVSYRVELFRFGTIVHSQVTSATKADLPLLEGQDYRVSVVALKEDLFDHEPVDSERVGAPLRLLEKERHDDYQRQEASAEKFYEDNPADLTPLTLYLGELIDAKLFVEALSFLSKDPWTQHDRVRASVQERLLELQTKT